MWKTWHNTVALTGGTAMISEPVNKPDVQAVWRNYEIMRPSSRENVSLLGSQTKIPYSGSQPVVHGEILRSIISTIPKITDPQI